VFGGFSRRAQFHGNSLGTGDHSGRVHFFSRSNAGVLDSNLSRGMDECVRLFCSFCPICR
jgi:hypothetical protein